MFSLGSNPLQAIRAGKRNNNTRIWLRASLPCKFEKWRASWREFCRSCKQKKLRTFFAFVIFPVSSKILSSLMESWCIVFVGIHFFSHKFHLKISEPLTCPGNKRNFDANTHFFPTNPSCTLHPISLSKSTNQTSEYIIKRAFSRQGKWNSKCKKKNSFLPKYTS